MFQVWGILQLTHLITENTEPTSVIKEICRITVQMIIIFLLKVKMVIWAQYPFQQGVPFQGNEEDTVEENTRD